MSDVPAPSSTPPEPPSEPAPATPTAPAAAPSLPESTGLQPNLAAAIASFFLLIGGIVFLILEKKDQYVRFYAMQSIFFGAVWVALSIGVAFVTILLHGIPLIGTLLWLVSIVIRLVLLVGWVVLFIKAYSGKEWELPYLGKLARQQLARGTPTPP
jgi:uncharacterized membrane protein